MIQVGKLKDWITGINEADYAAMDDGGLTLVVLTDTDDELDVKPSGDYIEIGGVESSIGA